MAGDWIKVRWNLHDDPDVIALAAAVGMDEYRAVGCLVKLWAWADQHSTDGYAAGVTLARIDHLVEAPGFAAALLDIEWLAEEDGGVSIPKFERHNSKSAKSRALAQRRMTEHRTRATDPSRTERNGPVTREETRRGNPPSPPPGGGLGLHELENTIRQEMNP